VQNNASVSAASVLHLLLLQPVKPIYTVRRPISSMSRSEFTYICCRFDSERWTLIGLGGQSDKRTRKQMDRGHRGRSDTYMSTTRIPPCTIRTHLQWPFLPHQQTGNWIFFETANRIIAYACV